jgi:puromycin-sensitive aminopeptidase
MLQQYLGADDFRDGIRHYLQTHQFGNTETTDLWDAIEASTGQPTRRIMDTWIFQGGYPVVSVDLTHGGRVLRLRQDRFRFDDGEERTRDVAAEADSTGGERWAVPVILSYGSDGASRVEKVLLDLDVLEIDLPSTPEWVVVNVGGSGFYRVRYSRELLGALTARGATLLTSIERYGLVDDTFASVLAGLTSAPDFLDFARGFADETDVSVWQRLIAALHALDRLVDDEARERFQATVRGLVAPALQRLGWQPVEDEGDRLRQLRGALFEALGTVGDDHSAQERARALHDQHVADASSVDPSLVAATIAILAHVGEPADWEAFRQPATDAPTPQEEQRYLYSLARFDRDDLVARTLDLCLTPEIRSQNAAFVIRLALLNRSCGPQAWEFVRRHWEPLLDKLPENGVVRMLEGIRTLTQPEVAADIRGFFAEHDVPAGHKTLEQHLDRLEVNVAFRAREADRLAAHLTA